MNACGLPRLAHLLDELERHLQLLAGRAIGLLGDRCGHVRVWLDLLLITQRVQYDDLVDRHQRRDVLPAAQDERSHGKLLRLLQRFAQQRVDALAVLVGHEEVGRVEVVRRDRVASDEGLDVDSPRGFHVRATEVLVREHHVFTFLILVPLHDVVPVDDLAGGLVVALVADGREVALVEQVEIELVRARRGMQAHRDVDEAEADGAVPQAARAAASLRRSPCRSIWFS